MSFVAHIDACNQWLPEEFIPFVAGGERLGSVRLGFAESVAGLGAGFRIEAGQLHWHAMPSGFQERSAAMRAICDDLIGRGLISHLHGEQYPVTTGRREDARFVIDRACAPYFGVRAFGQHLNGFVRRRDGLHLWVARRAADRKVYPNRLDNLVAGGLPWGLSLEANLLKECAEEAGMEPGLAARAVPVSAITYCRASRRGLKPDVMYCYDLELPERFEPRCQDGEVAGFSLWPVEQVAEIVRDSEEFKLNCNLVIIDFLIRHGLLTPEHPDYLEIVRRLRSLA
jgi:isopentenyldiphosphate isomerase